MTFFTNEGNDYYRAFMTTKYGCLFMNMKDLDAPSRRNTENIGPMFGLENRLRELKIISNQVIALMLRIWKKLYPVKGTQKA